MFNLGAYLTVKQLYLSSMHALVSKCKYNLLGNIIV